MARNTRLRRLRRERDWTLNYLARTAGVSLSQLHSIERGKVRPSLATAAKLARVFELPIEDLFDDLLSEAVAS